MVLFNHATREMTAKIVYYGPGLCGKTTNLMVIFDKLDPKQKGKMLSLATKTDRTLFFDLLPVELGRLAGFKLKIQLYTVPGQVFYNETRKLVLRGADSVVFVADSQPAMVEANRESFANLLENLQQNDIDPNDIPVVIQYNKRDLPGVLPVDQLQQDLGLEGYPYQEASALKGDGVMETFKLVSKITAKHLKERMARGTAEPGAREKAPKAKAAAPAPESAEAPAPAASAAPADNPFASTEPFADAEPLGSGYEKMEEVSLEQLLEGRERPATLSGAIPVPLDEIEDIGEENLIPEETPVAVAVEEEPAATAVLADGESDRIAALEDEVAVLRGRIQVLRDEQRQELQSILAELNDLSEKVRARLEA